MVLNSRLSRPPICPLPYPPSSPPKHLPYLSKFTLWLPGVPFHSRDYKDKVFAMRQAFGSFYLHLFSCDPTSLILPHPKKGSPPLKPLFKAPTPPYFGPYTPLTAYPTTAKGIKHFLPHFSPQPNGSPSRCTVWLNHSVTPQALQQRLQGLDRHQHKLYTAKLGLHFFCGPGAQSRAAKRGKKNAAHWRKVHQAQKMERQKQALTCKGRDFDQSNVLPKPSLAWNKPTKPMTPEDLGVLHSSSPPAFPLQSAQLQVAHALNLSWKDSVLRQHWWTSWDLIMAQRLWTRVGFDTLTLLTSLLFQ